MPRRFLLTLLLLAAVVTAAVLGPRTPAGRDWLLGRVQGAAEDAGWDVRWRTSAGNPWRSLELRGLEVAGAGIDAVASYARIRWFAPALLTGELPLWIEVRDADVAIDPDGFAAPGGTSAGPPIRPQLRDVDLTGIRLRVGGGEAYRLPDVSVEDVEVRGGDEGIVARGRLATRDGSLAIDATLDPRRSSFVADVRDADLTVARHWWSDVDGGTAAGTVAFSPEQGWTAELALSDGAFEVAGWTVREIDGPVVLQNALIETELSGTTLGGSVAATGRVDLANRRWSASARATPDVASSARWAAGDALPVAFVPEGEALVTATASGWRQVRVDASATATGRLDGRAFALATSEATYDSVDGLSLAAGGEALGGALDLSLRGAARNVDPNRGATPLRASATLSGASYGPLRDLSVASTSVAGPASDAGTSFDASADLVDPAGDPAEPVARVAVDGAVRDGATEAFGTAWLTAGGSLEGAATLRDGRAVGAVRVVDVGPLDGAPVAVTARIDGPLGALPVTLSVEGDAPWRPAGWSFAPELDLRGDASAIVRGTRLEELDGTFGPLTLQGSMSLVAPAQDGAPSRLEGRLAPVGLRGSRIRGTVGVDGLVVVPWTSEGTQLEGTVRSTSVVVADGQARIADQRAELGASLPFLAREPSDWRLRLDGPSLRADLAGGTLSSARVEASLDRLAAELAGIPTETSASFTLDVRDPLASLRGSAELASVRPVADPAPELRIGMARSESVTELNAELPAGFRLGTFVLPSALSATGTLPDGGDGTLRIDAGAVAFDGVAVAPDGQLDRLAVSGSLTTGAERADLSLDLAGRAVTLAGPIDLAPLARWAGVEVEGTATAEDVRLALAGDAAGNPASGTLSARLTSPIAASARWTDGRVTGSIDTPAGPIELSGTAAPGRALAATARHPWGELAWTPGDLQGGGATPAFAWRGTALPSVAWRLEAPAGATGPLTIVADRSRVRWSDGRIDAAIDLPVELGTEVARLVGDAAWTPGDGNPRLALAVAGPDGERWAELQGDLPSLDARIDAPAPVLGAAAASPIELAGQVVLEGPLDVVTLDARASGRWSVDDVTLAVDAERSQGRLQARLNGAGVDATLDDRGARITATGGALDRFVPALDGLVLDGALAFRSADGLAGWRDASWQGRLAVAVPELGEVLLSGADGPLSARLATDVAGVAATAEGTVLPTLALAVAAEHPPTGVTIALDATATDYGGGLDAIRIDGTLRLPAQTAELAGASYATPELDARLAGSLADLTIDAGEHGAWSVTPDGWDGSLVLDARIDGRSHPLALLASGPRLGPVATATLSGPSASGRATFDATTREGSTDVTLEPAAWPAAWREALGPGPVRLNASLAGDGVWTAGVAASLSPADRPLFLSAALDGRGPQASGSWLAAEPSGTTLLRGEVAADTTFLAVTSDAAGWNVPSFVRWVAGEAQLPSLSGAASGTVRYERPWDGGGRLSIAASLGGRVGDVGVRAVADVSEARTLVRIDAGDDAIVVERGRDEDGWTAQAAGARYAVRGELDADLRDGRLSGSIAERPLDLRLARNDEGLLAVGRWDDASLSLGVLRDAEVWRAEIEAALPAASTRTWSGSGSAALRLEDGGVRLDRLDAGVEGPVNGTVDLSGAVTPELDLVGSWTGPPAGSDRPIALSLQGALPRWQASADLDGLDLTIEGDGASPSGVAARGATELLPAFRIEAPGDGLVWTATAGWSGAAGILPVAPATGGGSAPDAAIDLAGHDGRLHLDGRVAFDAPNGAAPVSAGGTLAATASGPPWAAELAGRLDADGRISGRDGAPGVTATVDLTLGGTLTAPTATGPAVLEGAGDARGSVEASLAGVTLRLDGDALGVDARADTSGWSLTGATTRLSLAPWLPGVADPRLDTDIDAEGAWSGRPVVTARQVLLTAEGASLRGDAALGTGLRADLDLDADLGAALGGTAQGRLVGPVRVEARTLAALTDLRIEAALRADAVTVAGVSIDGSLDAAGALPVPDLQADLRLGGPVVGTVRATWLPDRRVVELASDLRGATSIGDDRPAWSAQLTVAASDGLVTADGSIEAGDGRLRVRPEDGRIVLHGEGGWSGARVSVAPFEGERGRIDVELPLGIVAEPIAGRLQATVSSEAGGLEGTVDDAALFGTPLPTPLHLRSRGSRLDLVDPADSGLRIAFDAGDRRWTAASTRLDLGTFGTLTLDGAGRATTGRLTARLSGPDGGVLDAEASSSPDAIDVQVRGTYRGGTVDASAVRDTTAAASSWTGTLQAARIRTPAGSVGLDAELSGSQPVPDVSGDLRVEGPVPAAGRIETVGTRAASIDAALDLPGDGTMTLAGGVWPALDLRVAGEEGTARLRAPAWDGQDPWTVEGATLLAMPGVDVVLAGERVGDAAGVPTLRARTSFVTDGSLRAELPIAAPADAVRRVLRDGLVVVTEGSLGGTLAWRPERGLALDDVRWRSPIGDVMLAGSVDGDGADLRGALTARADDPSLPARAWTTFSDAVPQPFTIAGPLMAITLRTTEGPLPGSLAWKADDRTVEADFQGETLDVDLVLAPGTGLEGRVQATGLPLPLSDRREALLHGSAMAERGVVTFDAVLDGPGRLRSDGTIPIGDLLPAPYEAARAAPRDAADLSLRLEAIDLAAVPGVATALPHLAGSISGIAEVRGRRVVLQLAAPELRTAGRALPLRLEAGGDLGASRALSFSGSLAGSPLQGSADLEALDLLLTLDRFPGQAPIEAVVGPLDADVEATGVLRLNLPWRAPLDGELRIATEYVRLERAGVVTTGVLTTEAARGRLRLDAAFEGDGRWTASANLSADELDVRIDAFDANATPLLGLVPSLARLDARAAGSLTLRASGTPANPRLTAESSALEIGLAGARYRLDTTSLALDGGRFDGRTVVTGVNPVGGRLVVEGIATVDLVERTLADAAVTLQGTLEAPLIGTIDAVDGRIDVDDRGRPRLAVDARLGAPLTVAGTLAPLALRATGEDLALRIPTLLLDRATADVDLAFRRDDGFRLSGRIAARDGRFALGIRPPSSGGSDERSSALRRFVFEDVSIVGRRLAFSENFGSAEFDADLRLSGTAATPRLSGAATAQRGTLRFSGRDFQLATAVARFEPSRGAYPALEVEAVARFDQRSVLQSAPEGVSFVRPSGSTFDVRLSFDAEVVPTPGAVRPFDLQIDPVLASNAEIAVPAGQGLAAGTRSLTEAELLQLVALGRLDLSPDLGAGDVAGGVARSALDNAVDLLLLAELQDAVADALGVDLVEIRTSALSDVLAGTEDPFGVSLRLGGYVDEGLFASFEIGRFADGDATETLSNTLALTYELGPIALDLATRVGFADVGELTTTTEISGTVRYQLTPFLAVEGGATLSTPETEARFGVTLRW